MSTNILSLVLKGIDELKETLISIDNRLRKVEETLAENRGKHTGLTFAKDIFVVICSIAAVVISFVKLSQQQ